MSNNNDRKETRESNNDENSINIENIRTITSNENSEENENVDDKRSNVDIGNNKDIANKNNFNNAINRNDKDNENIKNNESNTDSENIVNYKNNTNNNINDNNSSSTNNEKNTNNEDDKDNDTDNENSKESIIKNKNEENPEFKESDYNIYFEDDILCRICYDDGSSEPLVVPCTCKGTMAFVHKTCLERWLAESNSSACELCHYRYNTQRATKYKVCEAICKWIRYSDEDYDFPGRNVRTDIVVCCMLTPFVFIGSGLCILTADYYSHERFSKIPAAKWTSISLLLMIGIVVIGYYLWAYMVVRYHGQMWYAWWQRDSIVKVIIADVNRVP